MRTNGCQDEVSGIIGTVEEDGYPIVYALVPELRLGPRRQEIPHLAVVWWKYDGTQRNGMPDFATNERMLQLEGILSDLFEERAGSVNSYHRTGNGLKEFAYYAADPGDFMTKINVALKPLPRFPIGINFYLDEECSDLQRIFEMFRDNKESLTPDNSPERTRGE